MLYPAPHSWLKASPADCNLRFEDLQIRVKDGQHLHGWWLPGTTGSQKALIALHGNGYVVEDMVGEELSVLHSTGANVLVVDYRGYGRSSGLIPDEASVTADARAALRYLLEERRVEAGHIFLLGRSIGTGPATQLALETPGLAGLILESPFTSIEDAAGGVWYSKVLPLHLLLRTHFNNAAKIGLVQAPLLVISGTSDSLTPVWMAKELFDRARSRKQIYLVSGAGHDDMVSVGGKQLTETLRHFVQAS